jgi:hypothetical protein
MSVIQGWWIPELSNFIPIYCIILLTYLKNNRPSNIINLMYIDTWYYFILGIFINGLGIRFMKLIYTLYDIFRTSFSQVSVG